MGRRKDDAVVSKIKIAYLRKIRAKRRGVRNVWFGLGMMGLIGWSVTVPTLLGAALGIWFDKRFPGSISWTLTIMLIGLIVGCANAWRWVRNEETEIKEQNTDD